jgi:hypothetical protein
MKSRVAPTPIGTVLVRLRTCASSQRAAVSGDLGVEHDVEVGLAQPRQIGGARAERRDHVDVDAERSSSPVIST